MNYDSIISNSLGLAHNVLDFISNKNILPEFNKKPAMWVDYDKEADVLYISFRKPQHATKTVETDDDILIRKDGRKIVGITILHASKR